MTHNQEKNSKETETEVIEDETSRWGCLKSYYNYVKMTEVKWNEKMGDFFQASNPFRVDSVYVVW